MPESPVRAKNVFSHLRFKPDEPTTASIRAPAGGTSMEQVSAMTESSERLKSFLTRSPFFGGLEDSALDRIAALLRERRFEAGSTVFSEGDTGRSMYIIVSGQIVLSRIGDSGLRVRLTRLSSCDFFGETTLIEMQPRPYTAHVDSPTCLFELTNMDLYRLYREDVKAYVLVLQNINRELCRRLRKADIRITQYADETGDDVTQISSATVSGRPVPRPQ